MTSVLTLTVASGSVPVPQPDLDAPDTQVWDAPDGRPAAYFYLVGDDYWALLPAIGAFRVAPGGNVLAIPEEDAPFSLVVDAYRRTVLPQALQFFGREVLHASAVVTDTGVVGFCAYSQTGKSTLAFGLGQRGYAPWADDALVFETGPEGARALALPFAVRLRPASQAYFEVEPLPAEERPEGGTITVGTESLPLTALCVLSRSEMDAAGPVVVRRVAPGDAVTSLLPHAYYVSLRDERMKARIVRAYLELAGLVPVFELSFPAGLDELPAVMDELERVVLAREAAA
jgi:hypothetical protein